MMKRLNEKNYTFEVNLTLGTVQRIETIRIREYNLSDAIDKLENELIKSLCVDYDSFSFYICSYTISGYNND